LRLRILYNNRTVSRLTNLESKLNSPNAPASGLEDILTITKEDNKLIYVVYSSKIDIVDISNDIFSSII